MRVIPTTVGSFRSSAFSLSEMICLNNLVIAGDRCLFFFAWFLPNSLKVPWRSLQDWLQFLLHGCWVSGCVFFFFSCWLCRGRILLRSSSLIQQSLAFCFQRISCLTGEVFKEESCCGCLIVLQVPFLQLLGQDWM